MFWLSIDKGLDDVGVVAGCRAGISKVTDPYDRSGRAGNRDAVDGGRVAPLYC